MSEKAVVLLVNHLEHNCGVYQFFVKLTRPLTAAQLPNYQIYYIETNQEWEFDHWVNVINPDIILYNFYFSGSTMPWLNLDKNRHRKQIGLHHEGSILDKGFDLVLHQDPTNTDKRYFNLTRPIPEYKAPLLFGNTIAPSIGSFGFGLGGKGFGRVVETVCQQFDAAHINLLIPFAHFGDSNGDGAKWWANHCRALLAAHNKPNITLSIQHELLPESELLNWLYCNDLNCFFYDDNIGRGLSGTVDYALAVRKPIALTKSDQFRHIWMYDDSMLIEKHGLQEIINNGAGYLQKYHDIWSNEKLLERFNQAFDLVREK
jgi:hypothetical protein